MKKKNENEFDRLLREKLSAPLTPPIGRSWDMLEQKLTDAESGSLASHDESVLDEIVFSKLNTFRSPYKAEHWKQLAQRLQAEETVLQRIYSYKAAEALLLLLLVWISGLTFTGNRPAETPARQAILQSEASENSMTAPAENQAAAPTQASPPILKTEANPAIPKTLPGLIPAGKGPALLSPVAVQTATSPGAAEDYFLETNPETATPPASAEKLLDPDLIRRTGAAPEAPFIPSLEPEPITDNPILPDPGVVHPESEPVKNRGFRVGMFGGPDYVHVITPPFAANGKTVTARQYALGYSGGISFSVFSGRWEWETGLVYMAKSYAPVPVLYINDGNVQDGYDGEGITQIELNMLQLPVSVRRNLMKIGQWRGYAQTGLSLNLIAQANYYKGDQEKFSNSSYRPAPPPAGSGARNNDNQNLKELPKGWLEGGSFRDNAYLSGILSVGLERNIVDRWSVFGQPAYQHMLYHFNNKGIAPYNDKLHTFSWWVGVRVKL